MQIWLTPVTSLSEKMTANIEPSKINSLAFTGSKVLDLRQMHGHYT